MIPRAPRRNVTKVEWVSTAYVTLDCGHAQPITTRQGITKPKTMGCRTCRALHTVHGIKPPRRP
jgi:hypothetical protein